MAESLNSGQKHDDGHLVINNYYTTIHLPSRNSNPEIRSTTRYYYRLRTDFHLRTLIVSQV